jgi:hypothetical protein
MRADDKITRAEFITLINRAFGFTDEKEASFSDVSKDDWYNVETKRAIAAGYVEGYNDGTFRLNT